MFTRFFMFFPDLERIQEDFPIRFSGVVFVDNLDSFSLNVANALAKLGAVPWKLRAISPEPEVKPIAFLKDQVNLQHGLEISKKPFLLKRTSNLLLF